MGFLEISFSFLSFHHSQLDRQFSTQISFGELGSSGRSIVICIDSASMIGFFAEFVEIGEARFCPDTFLQVVFSNLSQSGFDGLGVSFRIE